MKIALLSNINIDPVNRLLRGYNALDVFESQGYGNELGVLLNRESSLYDFQPEMVFLIIDVMEIIGHELDTSGAEKRISEWFSLFGNSLNENIVYYITDSYMYGIELDVLIDEEIRCRIDRIWNQYLERQIIGNSCVRRLNYRNMVSRIGEDNAFSLKMWYMGKIIHSLKFQRMLADEIYRRTELEKRTVKKVLLLDLDNTLWRGLAGEHNNTPIVLSDEGIGLAYKNFQRVILQMKRQGVILGLVSKNNYEDALEIINKHPHMVLREHDFSVIKINWERKDINIAAVSNELNLGSDSFVFIDDSPVERSLVKEAMPEVVVPDFPEHPEQLAEFICNIWHDYFESNIITEDDMDKTEQYRSNIERNSFMKRSVDYDSYLKGLDMKLVRVDAGRHIDRFVQLVNKTNQFNLTTIRFSNNDISDIIKDENKDIFLYRVIDKFGDNGIVAAAITEYGDRAVITEFTMSCRVMGRCIENAIIEDMEMAAEVKGYDCLYGIYSATEKNTPVKNLYCNLGYDVYKEYDKRTEYVVNLKKKLTRHYYVERLEE